MNRKLGEMGFIHDAILQFSILRNYQPVMKPQYPFFINSELSLWVVFDPFFDVENTLVCFLTLDDLTFK